MVRGLGLAGVVREHGIAHLGHAVHVGAVHDEDVDRLVAVGGAGDGLPELGQRLQERGEGEIILVRPEYDCCPWVFSQKSMSSGDEMIKQFSMFL